MIKQTLKTLIPIQTEDQSYVLEKPALDFIKELHLKFNERRLQLLDARNQRSSELRRGKMFHFLPETSHIRESSWEVAKTPEDLLDRRVEITGPAEPKMMINALNSGACAFMCDFEDALSPTWVNLITGQKALNQAYQRTLEYVAPESGKKYQLEPKIATLLARPRGWHMHEKHVQLGDDFISASLFDFGLAFFHNAKPALKHQTGPYFYLPKMESHHEASLWNDVFNFSEDSLGISRGTIKCTVLIETLPAAFEMDEILYSLRDHIVGLNAGRWDYIFSAIKKLGHLKSAILPDRSQVTMGVPFMQSYCDLLVATCHRRNAHAMGGMAAFIPSRKDAEVNKIAMAKVREDKEREVKLGFDGTWVAHPDLVPLAKEVFDNKLGANPNQKELKRRDVRVSAQDLMNLEVKGSKITRQGVAANIAVTIQYVHHWMQGMGAVALYNLMEDAATAEISRTQLWQWLQNEVLLDDGVKFDQSVYMQIKKEELAKLPGGPDTYKKSAAILDQLVIPKECADFLTLIAYQDLMG